MKLKDVSLSKTDFFLRKTESSDKTLRKIYWKYFKKIIDLMEQEVNENTHNETDYKDLGKAPFRQGLIRPILSSPWVDKNSSGLLQRFISRVFLDVFSLQIFLCQSGETSLGELKEIIESLNTELNSIKERIDTQRSLQIKIPDNTLTSNCLCYWIEFVDLEDIDKNVDEVFEIVFDSLTPKVIDFSFAKVAFVDIGEDVEFCILVKDIKKATVFFNNLLPEYLLSWSKVKNEESILKQKAIEKEKLKLNRLLEEKSQNNQLSLKQLEEINITLSDSRTAFAEKLLDMKFHLRTLEINISNAQKLLNNSLLAEQKEILEELWVKPLRLVSEQTQAYISYYEIILDKCKIFGEKINNQANLKSAVYSRKITILFGLLSLIGILQLFPESFGKINVYLKAFIIIFTILVFLFLAYRDEIDNWFTKS